jgi:hypothetical protein
MRQIISRRALSRRSFGSIAIIPTQTQPEAWNHIDYAKNQIARKSISTFPETGDIEYSQNPRNHSGTTASLLPDHCR